MGETTGGDWERADDLVDEEEGENLTQKRMDEASAPVDASWSERKWGDTETETESERSPEEAQEGQDVA